MRRVLHTSTGLEVMAATHEAMTEEARWSFTPSCRTPRLRISSCLRNSVHTCRAYFITCNFSSQSKPPYCNQKKIPQKAYSIRRVSIRGIPRMDLFVGSFYPVLVCVYAYKSVCVSLCVCMPVYVCLCLFVCIVTVCNNKFDSRYRHLRRSGSII